MADRIAEGHSNARLERVVVRGYVREDDDWRPAIAEALRTIYSDPADHDAAAAAVDLAMIRAIHAGHRMDAVRDLGVVAEDSTNPLRRLWWRAVGSRRAEQRAASLNAESARMVAGEED